MTRIIAGTARGRRLQVPRTGTRPTSDRVRESLFSMLDHRYGGEWADLRVLDLFAGTGAFALEALSRGAGSATAVERHTQTAALIRRNAADCGLQLAVVAAETLGWLSRAEGEFDLVFLDPPYELEPEQVGLVLAALAERKLVAAGGLVLVERSSRQPAAPLPKGVAEVTERKFGDTVVQVQVW